MNPDFAAIGLTDGRNPDFAALSGPKRFRVPWHEIDDFVLSGVLNRALDDPLVDNVRIVVVVDLGRSVDIPSYIQGLQTENKRVVVTFDSA